MSDTREDVTQALKQIKQGDGNAANKLLPLVYEEIRAIARHYLAHERADHTLQPTALIHEAYMKLVDHNRVDWQGRGHFFAVAALAMRRILTDHARKHLSEKRGGGRTRVELNENVALSPQKNEDVLALDEALEKLAKLSPRQAKVVELRFFAGLSVKEVANILNISKRTVEGDWTFARAWLSRELRSGG
ncbi:MAG: sigma-70 family RNA polymerase sigma factor [Phycisphaerales bacterium]|nr:sigma-70 family RNA polymerase sigma factor [Phycisphaerales bacterium]